MAFDIDNPIGSGTDAEMLILVRAAIVKVAVHGQEYEIEGRVFTRANLKELTDLEKLLTIRVAQSSATSNDKSNLARFGRSA